jgi:hypothetical protein
MLDLSKLKGQAGRDPYWDAFVHKAPADANSLVAEAIRRHPEGSVYPVRSDVHSPAIMSEHIKELARFLGADLCGIAALPSGSSPFAVVCGFYSDYDPATTAGVGGQAAVLNGAYVTFNVAAWIRECGYRATRDGEGSQEEIAAQAGLTRLDGQGRLIRPRAGRYLYIADLLFTDLPLKPDGGADI